MRQQDSDEIAISVRELLCEYAPGIGSAAALPDGLRLASGGLGFDSVRVVELILACEERFQVAIPAEILEGSALTVGDLVAWVRQGRGNLA